MYNINIIVAKFQALCQVLSRKYPFNLNKYMGTHRYYSYFYREENSNLENIWLSQWGGDMIDGKMSRGWI